MLLLNKFSALMCSWGVSIATEPCSPHVMRCKNQPMKCLTTWLNNCVQNREKPVQFEYVMLFLIVVCSGKFICRYPFVSEDIVVRSEFVCSRKLQIWSLLAENNAWLPCCCFQIIKGWLFLFCQYCPKAQIVVYLKEIVGLTVFVLIGLNTGCVVLSKKSMNQTVLWSCLHDSPYTHWLWLYDISLHKKQNQTTFYSPTSVWLHYQYFKKILEKP